MPTKTLSVRCIGTRKKDGLRCTNKTKNTSAQCGKCSGIPFGGMTAAEASKDDALASAAEEANVPPTPTLSTPDSDEAPVTPFDQDVTVGEAAGTPFLLSGGDLYDSTATVHAYEDESGNPDDVHEVLSARLTPEAEEKLIDALAIGKTKMVPVEVTESKTGEHPVDDELGLHDKASEIARSINARMKNGESADEISGVNGPRIEDLQARLASAKAKGAPDELVAHYENAISQFQERLAADYATAYDAGGKIGMIDKWTGPYTHTHTKYDQQLIADDLAASVLPVSEVSAKRIDPWLDADGRARWDGDRTYKSPGKMWEIDLGDGYKATYRPTSLTEGADAEYSALRRITVTGPQGRGHTPEMMERLGRLNMVNEPMTTSEAEYTYLENVAYAMGGGSYHPNVQSARNLAAKVDDIEFEKLAHENFSTLSSSDPSSAAAAARNLRLQAEKAALPKKTRLLREAVAGAHGFGTGDDLKESPAYDPTPQRSGGWVTWKRPDMAPGSAGATAWKGKSLVHKINKGGGQGGGVLDILKNSGVLASQERRRQFGTPKGLGWSEDSDRPTGGASTTFAYIQGGGNGGSGARVVWSGADAQRLATRSDWFATQGDSFGVANQSHHYAKTATTTRDPSVAAHWTGGGEMMFYDGLDLMRSDAPTRIHCGSAHARDQGRDLLKKRGITHIGKRTVDEVLVA